jgi:signal transduction histidine kinase
MEASRIERDYEAALARHLEGGDEAALHSAYEIGRTAIADGLGVLDMATMAHRSILAACGAARTPEETIRIIGQLESFLLESLAPFEMAYRGAREANNALRNQNEALEAEMTRIAHSLHDAAGQLLACAHLALSRLGREAPKAASCVREVRGYLDDVEEQLRQLSHELRPTVLDDLGLVPALELLAEGISLRAGIAVAVEAPDTGRLPKPLELALYRIVQEALANVVKHAQASIARVDLEIEKGWVRCAVRDDGVGMDRSRESAPGPSHGLGLAGIRDRVSSLGGTLEVKSGDARGTEVRVHIPLENGHAAPSPAC